MRLRLLAAAAAAAVPSLAAAAQAGPVVGEFRFTGCDVYFCQDITWVAMRNPLDASPYLLSMKASLTPTQATIDAGNSAIDIQWFPAPFPLDYITDWYDGFTWFFSGLTPNTPVAFDYPWTAYRTNDPVVTGTLGRYYMYLPGDPENKEFVNFRLTPVATTAPEPATLALVAGGLALVGTVARRRRRRTG